jgi:Fur family ferric uptake transcriptional regulator
MVATSELERAINDRLAEHDLRFTTARRAIVEGLKSADGPITLPELLNSSRDLAQSSAYRNLSLLEEAGVVRRLVHGGEHAHFELAESLTEHHHHLICETCGLVRDITLDSKLERTLDNSFDRLAAAEGFVPTHHTVDVYGLCGDCSPPT